MSFLMCCIFGGGRRRRVVQVGTDRETALQQMEEDKRETREARIQYVLTQNFFTLVNSLDYVSQREIFNMMTPLHIYAFHSMSLEHAELVEYLLLKAEFEIVVVHDRMSPGIKVKNASGVQTSFLMETQRDGTKQLKMDDIVWSVYPASYNFFTWLSRFYKIFSSRMTVIQKLEVWTHFEWMDAFLEKRKNDMGTEFVECRIFSYFSLISQEVPLFQSLRVTERLTLDELPIYGADHYFDSIPFVAIHNGLLMTTKQLLNIKKGELTIRRTNLTDTDFNQFLMQWFTTGNDIKLIINTTSPMDREVLFSGLDAVNVYMDNFNVTHPDLPEHRASVTRGMTGFRFAPRPNQF